MIQPLKHDWPAIIREIIFRFESDRPNLSGLNTLAKMIHREHIQIKRWLNGSEPRHYEGQMLLAIHAEYVTAVGNIGSKAASEEIK